MILRDRVGGGGRAKASLVGPWAADGRLRDFTVSAACRGYACLGEGRGSIAVGDVLVSELGVRDCSLEARAGGGSSNDICSVDSNFVPSCPGMSVDEAGVGKVARGMFGSLAVE